MRSGHDYVMDMDLVIVMVRSWSWVRVRVRVREMSCLVSVVLRSLQSVECAAVGVESWRVKQEAQVAAAGLTDWVRRNLKLETIVSGMWAQGHGWDVFAGLTQHMKICWPPAARFCNQYHCR